MQYILAVVHVLLLIFQFVPWERFLPLFMPFFLFGFVLRTAERVTPARKNLFSRVFFFFFSFCAARISAADRSFTMPMRGVYAIYVIPAALFNVQTSTCICIGMRRSRPCVRAFCGSVTELCCAAHSRFKRGEPEIIFSAPHEGALIQFKQLQGDSSLITYGDLEICLCLLQCSERLITSTMAVTQPSLREKQNGETHKKLICGDK